MVENWEQKLSKFGKFVIFCGSLFHYLYQHVKADCCKLNIFHAVKPHFTLCMGHSIFSPSSMMIFANEIWPEHSLNIEEQKCQGLG